MTFLYKKCVSSNSDFKFALLDDHIKRESAVKSTDNVGKSHAMMAALRMDDGNNVTMLVST